MLNRLTPQDPECRGPSRACGFNLAGEQGGDSPGGRLLGGGQDCSSPGSLVLLTQTLRDPRLQADHWGEATGAGSNYFSRVELLGRFHTAVPPHHQTPHNASPPTLVSPHTTKSPSCEAPTTEPSTLLRTPCCSLPHTTEPPTVKLPTASPHCELPHH